MNSIALYAIILMLIVSFFVGLFTGMIISINFSHIRRSIYLKLHPNKDKILNEISADTKIILTQYMEEADYYGVPIYLVRDIKTFDVFLNNHSFEERWSNGKCDLNYCIKQSLKCGDGFIIFMNGEQYVAIRPPEFIDADCLVKRNH